MASSTAISSYQCKYIEPYLHHRSILLSSHEVSFKIVDLICSFED